jgi:hypothetical protein
MASIHAKPNELFETFELGHRRYTQLILCQELRLAVLHEWKQPVAALPPFCCGFLRESWLRLFVIEHAQPQVGTDSPDRGFADYGSTEPFLMRRTILVLREQPIAGARCYNHLLYVEAISAVDCAKGKAAQQRTQAAACIRRGHLVGQRWRKCRFGDQRQEQVVLASRRHLAKAIAWLLFRCADDDATADRKLVYCVSPK